MGTHYTIKVLLPLNSTQIATLAKEIKSSLNQINNALSNWQSNSELSRFNASSSTQWQPLSKHFYKVMQEAVTINQQSQGKFDVTLSPLINLWGFGPAIKNEYPSASNIKSALEKIGQANLLAIKSTPPSIKKQQENVTINLSAIAKGYAIDQISILLKSHKIQNFIVEIGGDLITQGVNINGQTWRVGIEKPNDIGQSLQTIIVLDNKSIAISGDYRNFFIKNGQRLSHIIDPKSGYPIAHNLASVTVITKTAMRADGLATAFLVMGEKEGIKLANKLKVAAYFITRKQNNYSTSSSRVFKEQYPNL